MSEETEEIKLTGKQKLFADYYVGEANLNATKAAIRAGYSPLSARFIGSENLTKHNISTYIERRLDELTMRSKEILVGFTNEAKGSIADVLDENGEFDYVLMCERGTDKLLKKLKIKTIQKYDPATKETSTETTHEFEMYDAQNAKVQIAKIRGDYVNNIDIKSGGKEILTALTVNVIKNGSPD